jgi:hypothetical protein
VNALADPKFGEYAEKYFVSAFQRVGTFRIVGKQKQGGNVATYFCAPDGRVLHSVAGPVNGAQLLREAQWVVETTKKAMEVAKNDGGAFKAYFRKAHAERLKAEYGLVIEPVTYDAPDPKDNDGPLSYRDPSGRPLAPVLQPVPIQGPDVKFELRQEFAAKASGAAPVADMRGRRWVLPNQGRVHQLMAAHSMGKIETLYASIFEGILGERVSTQPVEVVNPFPWHGRDNKGQQPQPRPNLRLEIEN